MTTTKNVLVSDCDPLCDSSDVHCGQHFGPAENMQQFYKHVIKVGIIECILIRSQLQYSLQTKHSVSQPDPG